MIHDLNRETHPRPHNSRGGGGVSSGGRNGGGGDRIEGVVRTLHARFNFDTELRNVVTKGG